MGHKNPILSLKHGFLFVAVALFVWVRPASSEECPACAQGKNFMSCCAKGGAWSGKCGPRLEYTWFEGNEACRRDRCEAFCATDAQDWFAKCAIQACSTCEECTDLSTIATTAITTIVSTTTTATTATTTTTTIASTTTTATTTTTIMTTTATATTTPETSHTTISPSSTVHTVGTTTHTTLASTRATTTKNLRSTHDIFDCLKDGQAIVFSTRPVCCPGLEPAAMPLKSTDHRYCDRSDEFFGVSCSNLLIVCKPAKVITQASSATVSLTSTSPVTSSSATTSTTLLTVPSTSTVSSTSTTTTGSTSTSIIHKVAVDDTDSVFSLTDENTMIFVGIGSAAIFVVLASMCALICVVSILFKRHVLRKRKNVHEDLAVGKFVDTTSEAFSSRDLRGQISGDNVMPYPLEAHRVPGGNLGDVYDHRNAHVAEVVQFENDANAADHLSQQRNSLNSLEYGVHGQVPGEMSPRRPHSIPSLQPRGHSGRIAYPQRNEGMPSPLSPMDIQRSHASIVENPHYLNGQPVSPNHMTADEYLQGHLTRRTFSHDNPLRRGSAYDNALRRGSAYDNALRRGSAYDNPLRRGSAYDNALRRGSAYDNALTRGSSHHDLRAEEQVDHRENAARQALAPGRAKVKSPGRTLKRAYSSHDSRPDQLREYSNGSSSNGPSRNSYSPGYQMKHILASMQTRRSEIPHHDY